MEKTSFIDVDKLECMANRLKAIAHPARIQIIELLQENEKLSVTELQGYLKVEQAATSNHLRLLKDQQIVYAKRAGKNKYYYLKQAVIEEIISCINRCM
jgi:DNA-binding transcriptional ArsR family regulator